MQVSIVLDQPGNVSYTNLDDIAGRVVLRTTKAANINNITVKLEGESRSRLLSPRGPNGEKPRPQLEYHKILYRLYAAFPTAEIQRSRADTNATREAYAVGPGQHEWPFHFKVPFNNSCSTFVANSMGKIGVSSMGLEVAKPTKLHVKKTLPPSVSGFPGEAEIRYFVKVTVVRNSVFKENPRAYVPFNFMPIEPPRVPPSGSEIFARQKHVFTRESPKGNEKKSMKAMLGLEKKIEKGSFPTDAPMLSVDARLPDPAILTCSAIVPLRILVKKLTVFSELLYLDSLQVSLIGSTKIRAHDVFRTESNSWIIVSKSNLGITIGSPNQPADTEIVLDNALWRDIPLPNTVAPTFETCNIQRSYQLDVRVGLQLSSTDKPQMIVLPLRLNCEVYSGIAPPASLLEAMERARHDYKNRRTSTASASGAMDAKLRNEGRKPSMPGKATSPTSATFASASQQEPLRPDSDAPPAAYDDAPPSYEDAIATDLPPVDAPRPHYAPPPPAEDAVLRRDEKKGWV